MVDYVYMAKSVWQGLLDAIRTKSGTTSTMTASEATTAVNNLSIGGDLDGFIAGTNVPTSYSGTVLRDYAFVGETFTTFECNNVTKLSIYCFYKCNHLTTFTDTSLTALNASSFKNCTRLTSIDISNLTVKTIPDRCFYSCVSLSTITGIDTITEIGSSAINGIGYLNGDVVMNNLVSLGKENIYGNSKITSFSSTSLKTIKSSNFTSCTVLKSINIPNVTNIEAYSNMLKDCDALEMDTLELDYITNISYSKIYWLDVASIIKNFIFPLATAEDILTGSSLPFKNSKIVEKILLPKTNSSYITYQCFYGCTALTTVDAGFVTNIKTGAFYGCTALTSLTLRATSSICTLSSSYSNIGIPTTCTVHVPSSMLSLYQTNTYWAAFITAGGTIVGDVE